MRALPLLSVLVLAALDPAGAQTVRRTGVYGELFGPAGAYALGVEQTLATTGSARLGVRVGAGYYEDSFGPVSSLDTTWTNGTLAVPAAAVVVFPLARPAGVPVSLETEAGLAFVSRSTTRPNAGSAHLGFPLHAGVALRTDLADGRFVARAGLTFGGVEHVARHLVVGVGVGL